MKHTRAPIFFALLMLMSSSPSQEFTNEACSEISAAQVASRFVYNVASNCVLSEEAIEALQDFPPPDGLELIGSFESDEDATMIYTTSLNREVAIETTYLALRNEGWEAYEPWSSSGHISVRFLGPMVCRDSTLITIAAYAPTESRYIVLGIRDDPYECDSDWGSRPITPVPGLQTEEDLGAA